MRYFYFSVFLLVLLIVQLGFIPSWQWVSIGIIIAISLSQFFLTKFVMNREINGEINIRKQRHTPNYFILGLVFIWTLVAISSKRNGYIIPVLLLSFFINDLLANQLYKKMKPVFICIKDEELILNGIWVKRRNIKECKEVNIISLTNKLIFSFNDNSPLEIDKGDFSDNDLLALIEYIKERSLYTFKIGERLKKEWGISGYLK